MKGKIVAYVGDNCNYQYGTLVTLSVPTVSNSRTKEVNLMLFPLS